MSKSIWVLRAPDGRVVGASARDSWRALAEGLSPLTGNEAFMELYSAALDDPTATRYEAAGYVLARGEVAK